MKFIHLHLGDLERSLELEGWIRSSWGLGLETLNPEVWFIRGQGQGDYLLALAPLTTETALELMMYAKLKIPYAYHLMIVPWLMTYLCRKQLGKEADLMITTSWTLILEDGMS